jgi:hypothetical protein
MLRSSPSHPRAQLAAALADMSDDEQDTMGGWMLEEGLELGLETLQQWQESPRWREYEKERYIERYDSLQPFRAGAFERTQQI